MVSHSYSSMLAVGMCLGAVAAAPTSRPTTRPVDERVARLIVQLGHEDFRLRDEASTQLEAMGPDALEMLEQVRMTDNPEIASRVDALLRRTGERPAAGEESEGAAALAVHHFVTIHKDRGRGSIEARNDVPDAVVLERVNETERYHIVMHRDRTGISITIAAFVAGNRKTEQYKVSSEAELEEKYPKLYEVHEALLKSLNPNDGMRGWWRQFAPRPEGPGREGRRNIR